MSRLVLQNVRDRDGALSVPLSLDVVDGSAVAIVASRRDGFRPLLRAIAGFEALAQGHVLIGDSVVDAQPVEHRRVAMLVPGGALYPHLRVDENLRFGLVRRGEPRNEIDRLVAQLAVETGVTPLLDRRPAQLSAEDSIRVALARALARGPAVLLVDDAFAGLDDAARLRLALLLSALQRARGLTTVLATTRPDEAVACCDRLVVLDAGAVVQDGTSQELYERPLTRAVAGLVGVPPMNLLELPTVAGHVKVGGRELPVPTDAASVVLGVRAEHLAFEPAPGTLGLDGRLEAVTGSGRARLVWVHVGQGALVALAPASVPPLGTAVTLHVAPRHIRFYGADTAGRELTWTFAEPADDEAPVAA